MYASYQFLRFSYMCIKWKMPKKWQRSLQCSQKCYQYEEKNTGRCFSPQCRCLLLPLTSLHKRNITYFDQPTYSFELVYQISFEKGILTRPNLDTYDRFVLAMYSDATRLYLILSYNLFCYEIKFDIGPGIFFTALAYHYQP